MAGDHGPDPDEVGPYRLLRRLGAGGMGTVHLGVDRAGRQVAVKLIRPDLARRPEFRDRLKREADSARRVARFCTAAVLDVDVTGDVPFLVTEFVDGPTLAESVRARGPLSHGELHQLAASMATALMAIHRAGIVHRDLKPGNIVLSRLGPKVIDFGIARALDTTSALTGEHPVGTPALMAPEQARGGVITSAADVFAWGGVLVYAGTGRYPFGSGPPAALLYRAANDQPVLDGFEDSLRPLVEEAMRKDPQERPSAEELYARLLDLRMTETASPVGPPLAEVAALVEPVSTPSPKSLPTPVTILPRPGSAAADETVTVAAGTPPPYLTLPTMLSPDAPAQRPEAPGRERGGSPAGRAKPGRRASSGSAASGTAAATGAAKSPGRARSAGATGSTDATGSVGAGGSAGPAAAAGRPRTSGRARPARPRGPRGLAGPRLLGVLAAVLAVAVAAVLLVVLGRGGEPAGTNTPEQVAGRALRLQDQDQDRPLARRLALAAYQLAPDAPATRRAMVGLFATDVDPLVVTLGSRLLSAAVRPDGRLLAAGTDTGAVELWDLADIANPVHVDTVTGVGDWVYTVAFSPNGTTLAAGAGNGDVRLWDVAEPGRPRALATLTFHRDRVRSVAFSPDGATLASGGDDGQVALWDVADPGRPQRRWVADGATGGIRSVVFSPRGGLLAFGGGDGTVRLWDVVDPTRPNPRPALRGSGRTVQSVVFSPDGSTIAAGGLDGSVRLWALTPSGASELGSTPGGVGGVTSVGFGADSGGGLMVSASEDAVVRLTDVSVAASPVPLTDLHGHTKAVNAALFVPGGRTIVSAAGDGSVRLWTVDPATLTGAACADPANLITEREWRDAFRTVPFAPPCR
ncbi:WD40 repeat domain-containing serine/threonine protein kinase [Parafrankia elaeagni]|uniref:WD40 repeat domain-containing serine/threonine protein kinase n=1 Tax=Parafrankia elaeagni TaxID=222534 RepID=UPI0003760F0E|nr:serine/threonine-protein kinase [Parafrankia elaeagni]